MIGRTNAIDGGSSIEIPLDAPTNFVAAGGNAQVSLTWTDPADKYATPGGETSESGDQLVSEWGYTRIVRKAGSQPTGPNDGTPVVEVSTRNQYQSSPYVDSGVQNDTAYYYAAYAYNKEGVVSEGAFTTATPQSYSPVLNDNTWEQIKGVAAGGAAGSVWAVGDRKEIVLNGTISKLSLSNYSVCVFILGFNHNASLEGNNTIHFQIGKTALTGGKDICMISGYDDNSDFYMNTSGTNSGGWKSSYMRNNILGTSVSSYNGTFIGALPADLRAVLKPVQKYTNNTGNSSSQSAVTATTDYMFLLGEPEVFGSATYANSYEANYQEQYTYYASGNSKVKYRHDSTGSTAPWWERSPRASSSNRFCGVISGGDASYNSASYSCGVAPAFAVG